MRKMLFLTAVLSATSLTLAAPAFAQVVRFDPGLQAAAQTSEVTEVRFRHHGGFHHGGVHGRGFHHRWRGGFGHRGYGRHYGGYGWHHRGLGVGAGLAGLAAGAVIGGAVASQATPAYVGPDANAVAYCSRRFKSYDPSSGTYLGYDGDRHACP